MSLQSVSENEEGARLDSWRGAKARTVLGVEVIDTATESAAFPTSPVLRTAVSTHASSRCRLASSAAPPNPNKRLSSNNHSNSIRDSQQQRWTGTNGKSFWSGNSLNSSSNGSACKKKQAQYKEQEDCWEWERLQELVVLVSGILMVIGVAMDVEQMVRCLQQWMLDYMRQRMTGCRSLERVWLEEEQDLRMERMERWVEAYSVRVVLALGAMKCAEEDCGYQDYRRMAMRIVRQVECRMGMEESVDLEALVRGLRPTSVSRASEWKRMDSRRSVVQADCIGTCRMTHPMHCLRSKQCDAAVT